MIKPTFIFHPDEKKFPIDITRYIESCTSDGDGTRASLKILEQLPTGSVLVPPVYSVLDIPFADESNFRCYSVEYDYTEVATKNKQKATKYILYFFKENGRLGVHYVDIRPDVISFDGYAVPREKVETHDGRFDVYVSLDNHTFYPSGANSVWCHALVPIDYTDRGRVWSPESEPLPSEIRRTSAALHPEVELYETKKIDIFVLPRERYINVLLIILFCVAIYAAALYAQHVYTHGDSSPSCDVAS